MKTLYLDLFSGIAGDMFIAALLDLGVNASHLERELKKLNVEGYHLHISRGQKSAITGLKFDVHLAHDHEHEQGHSHEHSHDHDHEEPAHGESACGLHFHESAHSHAHTHEHGHTHDHPHRHEHGHGHAEQRNFSEIKQLITASKLSTWVKQKSIAVFQRIAEAEGKIHGQPPDAVHFHEVGAVDSIVDIVGAAIALELLGKPRVLASPVIEGTGWIRCAHGRFPVPAPATLAILGTRGIGITQCEEPHELVTPTGAALLAEFVEHFGPMENLVAEKIGCGLGTRDNQTRPNVLRAVLGSPAKGSAPHVAAGGLDWETDKIAVLETNLDDCPGELLGAFVETALAAGALDVFHTPIQMKKNRPGILLTVLCAEAQADQFCELMLRETTAFGVRKTVAERRKLRRDFTRVETPFGEVTVKTGQLGGILVQAAPEFESAKKLAAQKSVPVKQIYEAVAAAKKIKAGATTTKPKAKAKPAASKPRRKTA
jgi:pyridinium-3,5-bisthiocarboxylic acid mononucleotide nickel chelatase